MIEDPFAVEFGAIFTSPTGGKVKIPGFYNGDKQWLLRFSASNIGVWKYTTYSVIKELNNITGRLEIGEATPNKHGGIQISTKNKQKFSYEDGTPYYLMAYECDWLFALDYHNDVDAPKTKHFLDLLANSGCTQIVMNAYTFDVSWPKDPKLKNHPEHDYGGALDIFPFLWPSQFRQVSRTRVR